MRTLPATLFDKFVKVSVDALIAKRIIAIVKLFSTTDASSASHALAKRIKVLAACLNIISLASQSLHSQRLWWRRFDHKRASEYQKLGRPI